MKTIEIVHEVTFKNKERIAKMIANGAQNDRQVLQVCTAINLWVAGNKIRGEAEIPESLVAEIMKIK